ncbi:hypothetical protein D3C78_1646620 [compost metagenome]
MVRIEQKQMLLFLQLDQANSEQRSLTKLEWSNECFDERQGFMLACLHPLQLQLGAVMNDLNRL